MVPPSPSLSLSSSSLLSRPRTPFPHCRSILSSVDTWERSFGGGGILTSDNHNSLCTRATVSSPSSCPLRCSSYFVLLILVWTRHSLCSFLSFSLSLLVFFSHRFFAMSFPPPSSLDHPVVSTRAIPQLFSTFLALVARLPLAGEFRVPSVTAYFTGISLSFLFFYCSSLSSPCCLGWYLFFDSSYLPLDFRIFSRSLHSLSFLKWTSEFMK